MTSVRFDTLGDFHDVDDTIDGKPYFAKEGAGNTEMEIYKILQAHPHPNIVELYDIRDNTIYMEKLDPVRQDTDIICVLESVKTHLQEHGIIYIDWKPDNIGLSRDGLVKLYDFDISGVVDVGTTNWIIQPLDYCYAYKAAVKAGCVTPVEIDDFAFKQYLVHQVTRTMAEPAEWF